jgi:beta-lactam-binding protein with PASTA domain
MKGIVVWMIAVAVIMGAVTVAYSETDVKGPVGSALVTVPNVVGKTLTEAMGILSAAGLNRETQQSDRDGERRIVVRQDPAAGTKVARGTTVKIYGQLASLLQNDTKGRVTLPPR